MQVPLELHSLAPDKVTGKTLPPSRTCSAKAVVPINMVEAKRLAASFVFGDMAFSPAIFPRPVR